MRTASGEVVHPTEVVFPLTTKETPGGRFRVLGTASFIGPSGLFLTAKHCVVDENDQPLWGKLIGLSHHGHEVAWLSPAPRSDLAIGQLKAPSEECAVCKKNRVLCLTTWTPEEREIMLHYGCADTPVEHLGTEGAEDLVRHRPTVTQYRGHCLGFHPEGVGLLGVPCFLSSVGVPSSASGGPVVSGLGRVCGVNSTSSEGGGYTTVAPVRDVLDEVFSMPVRLPDREPLFGASVREVIELCGGEILGRGP